MEPNYPNIVIVVIDSVRAQNLPLYGYEKNTTPFINELAKQSVVYKNAISTAPSTIPSHASLFTGTNVATHKLFDKKELSRKLITLPEVMEEIGYNTYGVCYQDDVSPETGLARGFKIFDKYDEPNAIKKMTRKLIGTKNILRIKKENQTPKNTLVPGLNVNRKKSLTDSEIYKIIRWHIGKYFDMGANATINKTINYLSTTGTDKPFFLYLHFDETHLPYRAPVPFLNRYMQPGINKKKLWNLNQDRNKFFLNEVKMDANDFNCLLGLYDGAIAYLDSKIASLMQFLVSKNMWDETMFVIFGDHGDNLGEHGLMSHKWCLYDTLIKVPLIVKYPKSMSLHGEKNGIVQQTDVVPTIIDMLGLTDHRIAKQLDGNSMISANVANRDSRYAISEYIQPFGGGMKHIRNRLKKFDRTIFSIRSLENKYLWYSDGAEEFFNIANDPDEKINCIAEKTSEFYELETIMKEYFPAFKNAVEQVQSNDG